MFSSVLRKSLILEWSVDSSHAVKLNISGFGWNILVFSWTRRSCLSGNFLRHATDICRRLVYQCLLGHCGVMSIIWHWNFLMCCNTFGMRQIGGNAYASMFSHAIDNASVARANWLGNHVQNTGVRFWREQIYRRCSPNLKQFVHYCIVQKPFCLSDFHRTQIVGQNILNTCYMSWLQKNVVGPKDIMRDAICPMSDSITWVTEFPLLVQILNHWCVVWANQHCMTFQMWKKVSDVRYTAFSSNELMCFLASCTDQISWHIRSCKWPP